MPTRTPATARTRTASTATSSPQWPPDLARAVLALGEAIDRQAWPRSVAYEVTRFLADAYEIPGLLHDPDDDDFLRQGLEHVAEAQRVIHAEVEAWDRGVPLAAGKHEDIPF